MIEFDNKPDFSLGFGLALDKYFSSSIIRGECDGGGCVGVVGWRFQTGRNRRRKMPCVSLGLGPSTWAVVRASGCALGRMALLCVRQWW